MFRPSTIIREIALNPAKVIFMLKHSVKLRCYLLCGCVAACCHTTSECTVQRKYSPHDLVYLQLLNKLQKKRITG